MNLNFTFDGNMSREVLESYLSRAVTAGFLHDSPTLEDDLRVIARLGVKFLGRASGTWGATGNDTLHFAQAKALADRVHEQDPEIILQACVFEYITPLMEVEKIPLSTLVEMVMSGEIRDAKTQTAVLKVARLVECSKIKINGEK